MNTTDLIHSSALPPFSPRNQIKTLALCYPRSWVAPCNPLARTTERAVGEWLRELGLLRDDLAAQRFARLAVGGYGGWPYPYAGSEELFTVTGFLTLWIFYDDLAEGAPERDIPSIVAAACGEPQARAPQAPIQRGFWELAQRYHHRQQMSERWLQRHAQRFQDWLCGLKDEALLLADFRAGVSAQMATRYWPVRMVNIGMLPMINFIEYELGAELPEVIWQHPELARIEQAACALVTIINDLYGFSKDEACRWPNLVSCISRERGIATAAAFSEVVALHQGLISEMLRAERQLRAQSAIEDRASLQKFCDRLHHIIHGFARWHQAAPRYQKVHDCPDGQRIALEVCC